MKKSHIIVFFYIALTCCIVGFLILINPFSNTLKASTLNQTNTIEELHSTAAHITEQLDSLQKDLSKSQEILNDFEKRLTNLESNADTVQNMLIDYYMNKLSDPTFTSIYNNEYVYYTAAEQLGQIGKKAIPPLINRLDTADDYERALVLYALLLASQDEEVKAFVGNNYIHTHLDFDARNHPEQVKIALEWWNKYQSYFSD